MPPTGVIHRSSALAPPQEHRQHVPLTPGGLASLELLDAQARGQHVRAAVVAAALRAIKAGRR